MAASSDTSSQAANDTRFLQEFEQSFEADVAEVAAGGDKLDLLTSIQSFAFHIIVDPSSRSLDQSAAVQPGFSLLWHLFLETAKIVGKDDPIQDRLILLLLWTKEFYLLHRSLHPTNTAAPTWESYRFADSLQTSWEQLLTSGTIVQQSNLASFSAKALAVGICQDTIGLTALWYLRETLEKDEEANAIPIPLLPAAVIWINLSRHKLLAFSATNQSYKEHSQAHLSAPGVLAQRADVNQHGFSLKRWLFWRRRLQELSLSSDVGVAKEAKQGFMCMINCGRELDYDVPGESKFAERLQMTMGEALVKSGKESLGADDIDIDVNWVD